MFNCYKLRHHGRVFAILGTRAAAENVRDTFAAAWGGEAWASRETDWEVIGAYVPDIGF